MSVVEEALSEAVIFNTDLTKNICHSNGTCNISELCRVCLVPTTSRKNSNLFFSSGRSTQLWAKVMACAWVQVFEGDGLPSQICYKCHNKLDIAYQFKQQCEAADAHIRQLLNRTNGNRVITNHVDLTQNQPECLAECKPLNFNITSECLDLVQSDLSLSSYRLSQDFTSSQQIDIRLRDSDFAAMKQEPGFLANLNAVNNLLMQKNECQTNASSFKCETLNESDIILDNLPTKLFETVSETISQSTIEANNQIESKIADWEMQQKNESSLLNKSIFMFTSEDNEADKNKQNPTDTDHTDIIFLPDNRTLSPLGGKNMISDVCSDSSTMDIDNECSFGNSISKDVVTNPEVNIQKEVFEEKSQLPVEVIKNVKRQKKSLKEKNINSEKSDTKSKNQCEICGKVFKCRSYIEKHLRTHTGVKPFNCQHCDRKFSMYHSLVTHLRTHSGDRPFVCTICDKRFTQSAGLKSHMRGHTGEKPYECEICAKRFSQKSNLIIHKQIHTGQRDHICTVCDKAFKFYKHLQSHMVLHSDKKEFKCSICQKGFQRKGYLSAHLVIHKNERPFKCNVCGHGFANSSNLRAHSRIHSGIKPYKCKVCKKAFSHSCALKRHAHQHSCSFVQNPPSKD